jgi:hypothetical protein
MVATGADRDLIKIVFNSADAIRCPYPRGIKGVKSRARTKTIRLRQLHAHPPRR